MKLAYEKMIYYSLEEQILELKYTWKISRNSSDTKTNFFVNVTDGEYKSVGEIAPNIRYGENSDIIKTQFNQLIVNGLGNITNLKEFSVFCSNYPICNSLRFGLESAFVHYLSNKAGQNVSEFLGLEQASEIFTAFSLPIMPLNELETFYKKHNLNRFKHIKLKVNKENAIEAFLEISRVAHQAIMVDGNESWTSPDEVLEFIKSVNKDRLLFIEQPLPSNEKEAYKYLKPLSPIEIIADESVTNDADMTELKEQFHGINMKLMKAGGYLKGVEILKAAKENGLKTMIGCMVETSVGISSAMHLCNGINYIDLDGFLIIKNEPFHQITEQNGQLKFA